MALVPRLEREIEAYFVRSRAAFRKAAGGGEAVRRLSCRIAGQNVVLRCAGTGLAAFLLPALQHLSAGADRSPLLEVDAFEDRAGGEAAPIPGPLLAAAARAAAPAPGTASPVYTYAGRRYRATWFTATSHTEVTLLDVDGGRAVVIFQSAAAGLPSLPASAPLRSLFALWFEHQSMTLVHAAALGTADGGFLIAAKSGGGKSTIALACMGSGLCCAGDDSLLVDQGERGARVHSIYCSGSVANADVEIHPALRELVLRPRLDRPKMQFFLGRHRAWLAESFPVRAVLLPKLVDGAGSRLVPASPSRALLVLGPSSINLAGGRPAARLARIAALARALPCFSLELGRRTAEVPEILRGLLAQLGAAPTAA